MPRGGARVGAGRKPKTRGAMPSAPASNVVVFDGGRAEAISKTPPKDLPADQQEFWRMYAPLALQNRTLTAQTVPAFRLLCELEAEKKAVKETIERDGRTYLKVTIDGAGQEHQEVRPHPLKPDYSKLAKQIETLMGKFMLAPFGKPIASGTRTKAEQQKATLRARFFGGAARG